MNRGVAVIGGSCIGVRRCAGRVAICIGRSEQMLDGECGINRQCERTLVQWMGPRRGARVRHFQTVFRIGGVELRLLDPVLPDDEWVLIGIHWAGCGDPDPPRRLFDRIADFVGNRARIQIRPGRVVGAGARARRSKRRKCQRCHDRYYRACHAFSPFLDDCVAVYPRLSAPVNRPAN